MKVVIQNHFKATELKFERASVRAVDRASEKGVRATKAAPTGYRIRGILSKTKVVKASVVGGQARGGFTNTDWREGFFEYGTLKRRRKPLKRPRRRQVSKGGIKPQGSMGKGRRVALRALPDELKRELGKVK